MLFLPLFQELYRKVKSILNKLTPQKFQKLRDQMLELPIDTEERLSGVIDIIFEKVSSYKRRLRPIMESSSLYLKKSVLIKDIEVLDWLFLEKVNPFW